MSTQTETWTYIGKRLTGTTAKPKLGEFWLDHEGNKRGFSGSVAHSPTVGHQYALEVTRDEDGVVVHGKGQYIGHERDDREPEWRTADAAARATLEQYRASKRAQREDTGLGGLTLDELREQYRSVATSSQRAGLMAAIMEHLSR